MSYPWNYFSMTNPNIPLQKVGLHHSRSHSTHFTRFSKPKWIISMFWHWWKTLSPISACPQTRSPAQIRHRDRCVTHTYTHPHSKMVSVSRLVSCLARSENKFPPFAYRHSWGEGGVGGNEKTNIIPDNVTPPRSTLYFPWFGGRHPVASVNTHPHTHTSSINGPF